MLRNEFSEAKLKVMFLKLVRRYFYDHHVPLISIKNYVTSVLPLYLGPYTISEIPNPNVAIITRDKNVDIGWYTFYNLKPLIEYKNLGGSKNVIRACCVY